MLGGGGLRHALIIRSALLSAPFGFNLGVRVSWGEKTLETKLPTP